MACNPAWTKGGCRPIVTIEDQGNCAGPAGGTKTIGVPQFVAVVDNAPDLIWRDENYEVVQADDDGSPFLFDNI